MKGHNNFVMGRRPREHRSLTEWQILRFAAQVKADNMTSKEATYARFEAFEEQLAHCYFLLHEHFITNPPVAKFWAETAMEEMQHFSMLRFCRERKLMTDTVMDCETAGHVEELLETVKGMVSDPDLTVDESFFAALLMESSELDDAYEMLTRGLANDHRILYDAIRANLRSHHDRFADAAEQFCKDNGLAEAFRGLGMCERRVLNRRSVS
jgi:hypothetical protein